MPLPRSTWLDLRTIFAKPRCWHARASTADARRRNWTRSFARQIETYEQKFFLRNSRTKAPRDSADAGRSLHQPFPRTRAGNSTKGSAASLAESIGIGIAALENYCG